MLFSSASVNNANFDTMILRILVHGLYWKGLAAFNRKFQRYLNPTTYPSGSSPTQYSVSRGFCAIMSELGVGTFESLVIERIFVGTGTSPLQSIHVILTVPIA